MARAGAELLAQADVAVPVPLWRWRLWWRRFNQAALLARTATRGSDVPVAPELLVRVRRTRQQVGLSRAARAETCKAPSGSRRRRGRASRASGSCSSTTS